MPFNLIMRRKVFALVQNLCVAYEERFSEDVATASVVNVLIAEALIHRGLLPEGFIKEKYGHDTPIEAGFTARARGEDWRQIKNAKREAARLERMFGRVVEQWALHPSLEWRQGWFEKARQYPDVAAAREVLGLAEQFDGKEVKKKE